MKLRREINLLDSVLSVSTSTAGQTNAAERRRVSKDDYSGISAVYLEVSVTNSSNQAQAVQLRYADTWENVVTVPASTSGYTRVRQQLTQTQIDTYLPSGATAETYIRANVVTSATGTMSIRAARLIIIQEADTIVATSAQFDIGNKESSRTNTTSSPLIYPKYWKYEAAKWNSASFFADCAYENTNNMYGLTVTLEESSDLSSWSTKATIVSGTLSTAITLSRVSFTPVDGRYYRIAAVYGNSMGSYHLYSATIVVKQNYGYNPPSSNDTPVYGGTATFGQNEQAKGLPLYYSNRGKEITGVSLWVKKIGSPSDSLVIELRDGPFEGATAYGTATIAAADLTTSFQKITVQFSGSYTPPSGNLGYVHVTRSPDSYDTSNFFVLQTSGNLTQILYTRSNNVWGSAGSYGIAAEVVEEGITLSQDAYQLLNTGGASLGPTDRLTYWDPAEWDGVENVYTHQYSTGSVDGDVVICEPGGVNELSGSRLTGNAAYGESSALTMPASAVTLDTKIHATPIAGARILVAIVKSGSGGGSEATARLTITKGTEQWAVYGSTGDEEAEAQSFTATESFSLTKIELHLDKAGSPGDNLNLSVRSGSPTGTELGSVTVGASTVVNTAATEFSFATPLSIVSGTTYYFVLTRTGARSTTNYIIWYGHLGSVNATGQLYTRTNNSWSAENWDMSLTVYGTDPVAAGFPYSFFFIV